MNNLTFEQTEAIHEAIRGIKLQISILRKGPKDEIVKASGHTNWGQILVTIGAKEKKIKILEAMTKKKTLKATPRSQMK